MKKLKTAGLYGAELLQISGDLVKRYNQALVLLGFEPTSLSVFEIDSIGWSPQIAEEKSNPFYLCHGEANPYGIIVSPSQQGSPVYFPFHSFDRDMVDYIYSHYFDKIVEITQTTAICIDIDQNIEAFYHPVDLLRYDQIRVGFQIVGDQSKAKAEQLQFIGQFMQQDNHLDVRFHDQILASARKYGDLRPKTVSLDAITAQVGSFYTRLFGGVFIIKESSYDQNILITEDKKVAKKVLESDSTVVSYHIQDPDLLAFLSNVGLIEIDKMHYQINDASRIDRIKQMLFAQAITEAKVDHSIDDVLASRALVRKFSNELKPKQLARYNDFCRIVDQYIQGNQDVDGISQDIRPMFYHPATSLEEPLRSLIWQLLGKVSQYDPFTLYKYDKEEFYKAYQSWEESLKEWVTQVVIKYNQKNSH